MWSHVAPDLVFLGRHFVRKSSWNSHVPLRAVAAACALPAGWRQGLEMGFGYGGKQMDCKLLKESYISRASAPNQGVRGLPFYRGSSSSLPRNLPCTNLPEICIKPAIIDQASVAPKGDLVRTLESDVDQN
jgi:hypothetical protein